MTSTTELPSWSPRSYQKVGVKLMVSQACAGLLYKPGLGKTSVVYMASRILQEKGFVNKILVVCPIRPMYNVWPNQCQDYAEFSHLRVGILHGPDREEVLASDDYDIYVVNPDSLAWLYNVTIKTKIGRDGKKYKEVVRDPIRDKWMREKFDMLVVDESTEFRNSDTNRFKIIKYVIKTFKRRYIMTGTPTPKSLLDLFGQIYILDEGDALGQYVTHFRVKYFIPTGYGGYDWKPQPGAKDRILERCAKLAQVVEAEGNIDLPDIIYDDIWVTLPPGVMAQYKSMEDDLKSLVESGMVVAENAAVASSKCRQIANGALYHEGGKEYTEVHDEKLKALGGLLEELSGDPVLVTYEFLFDRDRIAGLLDIPCISTGNVRTDSANIDRFSRGELVAVQGHPQSISLGIDGLQKHCWHIAMFGVNWNLLHYEQVINRVRRSGNKNERVIVHRILARDTIDEQVIKVLDKRDREQRDFMKLLSQLGQ